MRVLLVRPLCIAGMLMLTGAVVVLAQTPATPPTAAPQNAATVNGEPIPMSELIAILDVRKPIVPLPEDQKREFRKAALDLLIDDALMRQFFKKNAPAVTAADIDKAIADVKETLARQKPAKSLPELLREGQQTEEQFRADLATRWQWLGYLNARIPDVELKAYYEANKLYFDEVHVQASHILVKVGQDQAERQKAREKLEVIRQDIVGGKVSFEDAARKYSDCPSKDKKGEKGEDRAGDIGPFPYRFVVVEPFAKAAFAMKRGELSGIVATDFGMHLIKVTDRIEGKESVYESIRDKVRETYAEEHDLYQKILADQRKAAEIKYLLP